MSHSFRTQGDVIPQRLSSSTSRVESQSADRDIDAAQSHTILSSSPIDVAPIQSSTGLDTSPPSSSSSNGSQNNERSKPSRSPNPKRHHRIPSTGGRALVMDVAQALEEHEKHVRDLTYTSQSSQDKLAAEEDAAPELPTAQKDVQIDLSQDVKKRNGSLGPAKMEQRRSSYEKYSAFIMPPLAEVPTPVHSPAGTLARGDKVDRIQPLPTMQEQPREEKRLVSAPQELPVPRAESVRKPPPFTSMYKQCCQGRH